MKFLCARTHADLTQTNAEKCAKLDLEKFKGGFSFVEVIVSVFLLSVGIISVMSLMNNNLRESIENRNSVIGSGLVQEGLELVRSQMDNNLASGSVTQFNGLNAGNYCIGLINGGNVSMNNCADYSLYFSPTSPNIFYTHQSAMAGIQQTIFKRNININIVGSDRRIRSTVWWSGDSATPAASDCNIGNKCNYAEMLLVAR